MNTLLKTNESGYKDLSLKIKDEIYQLSKEDKSDISLYEKKAPELQQSLLIRHLSFPIAIVMAIITFFLALSLKQDFRVFFFMVAIILGLSAFSLPIIAYDETKDIIKLSKRYEKYIGEIGESKVISVSDLASVVALDEEKTIKDIRYMIQNGYFKNARLVENNTLLILDKQTFDIYKMRKAEILEDGTEDTNPQILDIDLKRQSANILIENCKKIIHEINTDASNIKNMDFIDKVDSLLSESMDILNYLDKYPRIYTKLNKFESYYLPTSAKLIKSYRDFEEMNLNDPLISNTQAEINESLVILIDGFKKLKLDMMNYQAMDIRAEKETMQMILNLDGYSDSK